ncbi:Dabb family protein [Caproicibacterium sp. BJN0003]|uniref:Dabb family protein n=1 Tax=Caproicibacterium sp. BJN0003 TaxID=2994078 RepID=UPI00224E2C6C|nr:Dabb family protein [Caproicibacterium sp. BJN0003]UZT82808.1 Dabb family protein [Caproicibacterium sp. BJN0003]
MVKHLVLWKLKDSERKNAVADAALLRSRFNSLIGIVDGLKSIQVGANYKPGNYDLCLECVFDSKEDEEQYQVHPEHLKIKALVAKMICGRTAFDYEI